MSFEFSRRYFDRKQTNVSFFSGRPDLFTFTIEKEKPSNILHFTWKVRNTMRVTIQVCTYLKEQ